MSKESKEDIAPQSCKISQTSLKFCHFVEVPLSLLTNHFKPGNFTNFKAFFPAVLMYFHWLAPVNSWNNHGRVYCTSNIDNNHQIHNSWRLCTLCIPLPLVFVLWSPHLPSYPLSLLKRKSVNASQYEGHFALYIYLPRIVSSQWYHFIQLANILPVTAFYQAVSRNNTGLKTIIWFFLSQDHFPKHPKQSLSSILYKGTDLFNKTTNPWKV